MKRHLLVVLVMMVVASVASAQNFGSDPIAQFFRFEWKVEPSAGRPVMKGYVYNGNNVRALDVRLLAVELDAAGRPVKETATWVAGGVPVKGRTYFEVPVAHADAQYRVTLESFTWGKR